MASQEVASTAASGSGTGTDMATKVIDDFLKHYFAEGGGSIDDRPSLSTFKPSQGDDESNKSLLADLWLSTVDVPLEPKEEKRDGDGWTGGKFPSLLLHELKAPRNKGSSVYKSIDSASKEGPHYLYGTSGAGKTRSIFEYLSHNKGFYFLCHDFRRNPGSKDLAKVLNHFHEFVGIVLPEDKDKAEKVSEANYLNFQYWVRVLLYIRHSVYRMLEQRLGRELTPYEWLLYQLYPDEFLGCDLFAAATSTFVQAAANGDDDDDFRLLKRVAMASGKMTTTCEWSIFIDEAQALLHGGKLYFKSSTSMKTRSPFSALAKALCNIAESGSKVRFPVFAGTDMALDELEEEASSVSAKKMGRSKYQQCFTDFPLLDEAAVKSYLEHFLDLSSVTDDVLTHVAKWLRGRPRWAAAFLEVYVMRSKQDNEEWTQKIAELSGNNTLLEALERYLNVMTCDQGKNSKKSRRESWNAGDASALASFQRMMTYSTDKEHMKAVRSLVRAVLHFAVGERPTYFDKQISQRLIRFGLAAIAQNIENGIFLEGFLDEPLIVEAGLNYLCIDEQLQENLIQDQESGGQGHAFERLILPALLQDQEKLRKVASEMVEEKDVLGVLPLNYSHGTRSSYGVLALDAEAKDDPTTATLAWIRLSTEARFEGQVPPFCFPCEAFGPDILFLLYKKDYSDFRACLVQSKFRKVMSQPEALRTLVPDWLFFSNRDKAEKRKLALTNSEHLTEWGSLKAELVSDDRPCVRLMVQYPKKKIPAATPGFLASDVAETNSKDEKGKAKRDLLLTIDDENFTLFGTEMLSLVSLMKSPEPKKQKRS